MARYPFGPFDTKRDPDDPFGNKARAKKAGESFGKELADRMLKPMKAAIDEFFKDRAKDLQKKKICMVLIDDGNKTLLYEYPLGEITDLLSELNHHGRLIETKERFKEKDEKTNAFE